MTVNFASDGRRPGDEVEGFSQYACRLHRSAGSNGQIEAEVGLSGNADLAADQPAHFRIEMDLALSSDDLAAVNWTGKITAFS